VNAVLMTYDGAQTVVRTEGQNKAFVVKLGLRQGSVLSPLCDSNKSQSVAGRFACELLM